MCIFFVRERERERASKQAGRSGERERDFPGRLCAFSAEPGLGLGFTNCEVVTRAETKSRIFNQLRHPGALHLSPRLLFSLTED